MPDVRWGKLGGGTQLLPDIDYFFLSRAEKTVRYLRESGAVPPSNKLKNLAL